MRPSAIAIVALSALGSGPALGVASSLPSGGCSADGSPADSEMNRTAMFSCLDNDNGGTWNEDRKCGGRSWYKTHFLWDSIQDCYNQCAYCILQGIQRGVPNINCDRQAGAASCSIGYF
ncbi:MAG: hypothetical protein M1832_002681 [Thelocarpon impressellum]|nr:MAG: hypothetical protein M1832_002681 [Thelocarpon impressellum]